MNFIHPTAILSPNVKLVGDNIYIGPYCVIGSTPESREHFSQENQGVVIYDNTVITGHVTIDAGIEYRTVIGQDCFIMKHVHIGHDACLGRGVTVSPHASIGGYVTLDAETNIGMGAAIHQRVHVPQKCMIGMNTTVTKTTDLWENGVYVGSPARRLRDNNRQK